MPAWLGWTLGGVLWLAAFTFYLRALVIHVDLREAETALRHERGQRAAAEQALRDCLDLATVPTGPWQVAWVAGEAGPAVAAVLDLRLRLDAHRAVVQGVETGPSHDGLQRAVMQTLQTYRRLSAQAHRAAEVADCA